MTHPLALAILMGKMDMIDLLVKTKDDIPPKTISEICTKYEVANFRKPLDYDTLKSIAKCVEKLLNIGAHIDLQDANFIFRNFPLESTKSLQKLIDCGIDINQESIEGQNNLRGKLVGRNGGDFFEFLLAKGANPNKHEVLFYSCNDLNLIGKVRLLVKYGADVNLTDKKGFLPLIEAVRKGNIEAIEILLKAGADINRQTIVDDSFKETNGLVIDKQNRLIMTPLTAALTLCEPDHDEAADKKGTLTKLLENGASTWVGDNNLIQAAYSYFQNKELDVHNEREIVEILLDRKDDTNANGKTALMHAIENDSFEFAKFLIKNGANIGLHDNENNTALNIALNKKVNDKDLLNDLFYKGWSSANYERSSNLTELLVGNSTELKDLITDHYKNGRMNLYNIARAKYPIKRAFVFFPVSIIITSALLLCMTAWFHVFKNHILGTSLAYMNNIPTAYLFAAPILPVLMFWLVQGIRIGVDDFYNNSAKAYCKENGFDITPKIHHKIDPIASAGITTDEKIDTNVTGNNVYSKSENTPKENHTGLHNSGRN